MPFNLLRKLSMSDRRKSTCEEVSPTCKRKAEDAGRTPSETKRMSMSVPGKSLVGEHHRPEPSAPTTLPWPLKAKEDAAEPSVRKDTKQSSLCEPEVEKKDKGKGKAIEPPEAYEELAQKLEKIRLQTEPQDNGEGSSRSQSKMPVRDLPSRHQEYFGHNQPVPDVRIPLNQRASGMMPYVKPLPRPSPTATSRMPSINEGYGHPMSDQERFFQAFGAKSAISPSGTSAWTASAPSATRQAGPSKQLSPLPDKRHFVHSQPSKLSPAYMLAPRASQAGPSRMSSLPTLKTDISSRPSTEESVFSIPEFETFGTAPETAATTAPSSVKDDDIGRAK